MGSSSTIALAALCFGTAYAQGYGDYSGGGGWSDPGSGSDSSGSSGYGEYSNANIPFGGDYQKAQAVTIAHGVLGSLAFVIFFPFGAIGVRLFTFPGHIWLHAAIQALAYLIFIAAAGLGIYVAKETDQLDYAHPIIGLLLLGLIFFQPFLGILHHLLFKKHNRRTFWSHAHIWLGRIVITLGMINGGLGLQLADNTRGGEIAYGVVAGVIWLAYVASIFIGERKRRQQQQLNKTTQSHVSSGDENTPSERKDYG